MFQTVGFLLAIKKSKIIDRIIIPATSKEVYDAFIDPKKHSKFTGSKATGKPNVGSTFSAWDGYITGKYVELEEGKKIIQNWITTDWPQDFPTSRLELTFKDLGNKTEIKMVHSDIPVNQEADLRQGWIDFYWKPLKDYFEKTKNRENLKMDKRINF